MVASSAFKPPGKPDCTEPSWSPSCSGLFGSTEGKGVLSPQLLAHLLKDVVGGLGEVFEHLFPLSNAHQQIALVGCVPSMFLHVFFIIADPDRQGNASGLQGAGVLRVCHNLLHQLLLLDFCVCVIFVVP